MEPKFYKNSEKCIVWIPENLEACRSPIFTFRDKKWFFKLFSLCSINFCSINISINTTGSEKRDISFPYDVYVEKVFLDGQIKRIYSTTAYAVGEYTTIEVYILRYKPLSEPFQTLRLTCVFPDEVSTQSRFSSKKGDCWYHLIEDMKGLLNDGSLCDVELKCEEGTTIKAHKVILSARSKVFAAMLQSDMQEGRSGEVKIPDLDAENLKTFLLYIYTGTLPDLNVDGAKQLYEASDKYAVLGLKRRCAEFLSDNFSAENVCDMLVIADLHSDESLKEKAIAYILENSLQDRSLGSIMKSHPYLAAQALTKFYLKQNQ